MRNLLASRGITKLIFIAISLFLTFGNAHGESSKIISLSSIDAINKVDSSINPLNLTSSNSFFNQLGNMFVKGTLPTREETYGWWSGRCYQKHAPDSAIAVLLISRLVAGEDGPAFPEKRHQLFSIYPEDVKPANYFDNNLSRFQSTIENLIEEPAQKIIVTKKENGSWSSINTLGMRKYSLKKYKSYFILQLTTLEDVGSFKTGDVFSNCYFFKQVYSY